MEVKELSGWIRKAGKTQRVLEFQCPYIQDFYVDIAYANKFVLNQIREVAREVSTNLRTGQREERINDDKFRQEYSRHIIRGWRGLTFSKLSKIIPGIELKDKEDLNKEIPFSQEIALALLEVSIELESWVVDIAIGVENYSNIAERKEKEYENLKK